MKSALRFAGALSTLPDSRAAIRQAIDDLEVGLDGATPDVVLAFATHHHGPALDDLGPTLARATGTPIVSGCTAEAVIGGSREAEGRPGIALWAARLPGTEVRAFEVSARQDEDGDPVFSRLPPVGEAETSCLLLTADPYTFPLDAYLTRLNNELPGIPAMGGMASGAMGPGQTLFFTQDGVRDSGAHGLVLDGAVELFPVVSQGCRPIGKPWVITECDRNHIKKLGGHSALEVFMTTLGTLPGGRDGVRQSPPFLGLAIDPNQTRFERGDFLVRGIMGLNHRDRSIAVADFVRRGQTVQLLVRDAESASEDLASLIDSRAGDGDEHTSGALLFSCNGRGKRMFGRANHDAACVRERLGSEVALAGFFAAGEIGPVGGRNFLHGFTASVAVFRPRSGA